MPVMPPCTGALVASGTPESVALAVERSLRELGLERPTSNLDEPVDPRELLWWLLRMAAATSERAAARPRATRDDLELVAELEALVAARPAPDVEHCQLMIDPLSVVARARQVPPTGRVLLIGDDDCTSLALGLLGRTGLHVVDIDTRLLEFLDTAGQRFAIRTGCIDVDEDAAPQPWRETFDVVVTDPIRSLDGCMPFVRFAASVLRPGGTLLWADHPDWNLELDRALAEAELLGLTPEGCVSHLHAYPLTAAWLGNLPAQARQLDVDSDWLARLVEQVTGVSHLYRLRRGERAPGDTGTELL